MSFPWDNETIHRNMHIQKVFAAGESLAALKTKIASMPPNIDSNMEGQFIIIIKSTKSTLKSLFETFPNSVPPGMELDVDLEVREKTDL